METKNPVTKISKYVSGLDLSPPDTDMLLDALSHIPSEHQDALHELVTSDPGFLNKLVDNYTSKQAAIAADSPEMWEKILQEEEQTLRGMTE